MNMINNDRWRAGKSVSNCFACRQMEAVSDVYNLPPIIFSRLHNNKSETEVYSHNNHTEVSRDIGRYWTLLLTFRDLLNKAKQFHICTINSGVEVVVLLLVLRVAFGRVTLRFSSLNSLFP